MMRIKDYREKGTTEGLYTSHMIMEETHEVAPGPQGSRRDHRGRGGTPILSVKQR